jgi:arylsulfatase A
LPQILGKNGEPREWIYTWYSKGGTPPFREFVTTMDYKLYRNGRFYDLGQDPFEDQPPRQIADLTGREAAAAKRMEAVLAQYADARPVELRKAADEAPAKKPGKRAGRRERRQETNENDE